MGYENTIGWKNNNLGNLRGKEIKWLGKTGFESGFSTFVDRWHGLRAIYVDIYAKMKSGKSTIEKIIEQYAPRNENDTDSYIKFVEKETGLKRNTLISLHEVRNIVKAIVKKEIGYAVTVDDLNKAEQLLKKKL